MFLTRRQLLRSTSLLPIGIWAGFVLEGCGESIPMCADPELLSAGETQMRETLGYVERAADASKPCGACRFFTMRIEAQKEIGCGRCQILDGMVSKQGHCDSWSARS